MKNVNIKDIAKIAGVGVATVSRVLNNHPDVKEETRVHILNIIDAYNYIPNNSARNLKRTESNDIGIIVKGVHNPFFAEMILTIEKLLSRTGYTVLLHYNTDETRDLDVAHEFAKEKRLIGLICLGGDFEDAKTEEVKRLGIPLILTSTLQNKALASSVYSSIGIDNERASYEATDYLCSLGHKKIGMITTGEGDLTIGARRTAGYLNALKDRGIPKVDERFELGDYSFEAAYQAMKRLLEKASDLTAVFAISDIMAIGASRAILEAGHRIPEDISVVGFDDIEYAKYFNPPMTTVHQPLEEIAEATASLMIALLDDGSAHEHLVFPTSLRVRETTMRYIGGKHE